MALITADRAEVSWDNEKSQWLVRIQVGEEVIRRHWKSPKDAGSQTLQADAVKTRPPKAAIRFGRSAHAFVADPTMVIGAAPRGSPATSGCAKPAGIR